MRTNWKHEVRIYFPNLSLSHRINFCFLFLIYYLIETMCLSYLGKEGCRESSWLSNSSRSSFKLIYNHINNRKKKKKKKTTLSRTGLRNARCHIIYYFLDIDVRARDMPILLYAIGKTVKIGILRRIVRSRWDHKILHIFKFKAKNTLIMTLYIE